MFAYSMFEKQRPPNWRPLCEPQLNPSLKSVSYTFSADGSLYLNNERARIR